MEPQEISGDPGEGVGRECGGAGGGTRGGSREPGVGEQPEPGRGREGAGEELGREWAEGEPSQRQ